MKTFSPHSRLSGVFRRIPAHPPAMASEGRSPAGPSVREALREIGITLAVHLAGALAIVVALQAYGIA